MREETKEWLERARRDFKAAKYNYEGDLYEVAAFLCQQSAEKALKAVYIEKFGELVKTHDLHFLGKKLGAPQEIMDSCKELSTYFVESRYPGGYARFGAQNIMEALRKAGMVLEWAKGKI
ncbi:MAG: HEPN domain-containing protein [Candidatus Micrarchaeota archaeon]